MLSYCRLHLIIRRQDQTAQGTNVEIAVVQGEKWIATRWMRSTGMDYPYLMGRGHSQEHAQ